jgi:hypothetical protein
LLGELRPYILPSTSNDFRLTPFSHLKHYWLIAAAASRNERSLSTMTWSTDKTEFEYSRPGLARTSISLASLRRVVHHNQSSFFQAFESLFPSTYNISTIHALPWESLKDSGNDANSFLDAADVWENWLHVATTHLVQAYLDPTDTRHGITASGTPQLKAMDGLLSLDQIFQNALIIELISNTGVSPRAVTTCDYLYRSGSVGQRNLHLISGNVVLYGGRQKGESRRDGLRELIVRAFCPEVGGTLVRYLALVRRAIIEILKMQNWYMDSIQEYSTRLFVRPIRPKSKHGVLEVSDITETWHIASLPFLGVKLNIVDMRQIGTGIFCELFPELIQDRPSAKSAVDGLGDHGPPVRENHYGRNSELFRGLSGPHTEDFLLTCNAYQALMQVIPVDMHWPAFVLKSPGLGFGVYEKLALNHAQYLVPCQYGFSTLTAEKIHLVVKDLCKTLSFLFSQDVGLALFITIFLC